jgi:hypothetical protein
MFACIEKVLEEGVWRVRYYDGRHVLTVEPKDLRATGWPDYEEAYEALYVFAPDVDLLDPELWYVAVSNMQHEA